MLENALRGIKETLAYEGYEMIFMVKDGGVIDIQILAGPDACEDCLVPKPILENMIITELNEHAIAFTKLNLHTPKE